MTTVTQRPGILSALKRLLRPRRARNSAVHPAAIASREEPGRSGTTATVAIAPPRGLRIAYAPEIDGDPDAGEIVWTWVPYAENDGRGKDRPVLVIARQDAAHVFVIRLTTKAHDGDRDFLPIGTGAWDSQGRPSWVDTEQIYRVHAKGMRREASALPRDRFAIVADALRRRHGWPVER